MTIPVLLAASAAYAFASTTALTAMRWAPPRPGAAPQPMTALQDLEHTYFADLLAHRLAPNGPCLTSS